MVFDGGGFCFSGQEEAEPAPICSFAYMSSPIDIEQLSVVVAGLLILMAVVHFLLAFGLRRGDLVWAGRHSRRLPPDLRRRSLGFGVLLLVSSWLLAELAGFKGLNTIPEKWYQSVGFVITVFFAVTGLYAISRGGRWERRLFGPVLLSAAILAGLLTFG